MRFVYQVRTSKIGGNSEFFYAEEGDALQAARRSAEDLTNSPGDGASGMYKVNAWTVTYWTTDTMVISDKDGKSLVHVYRHPVL